MDNIINILKSCPMVFAATADDDNRPNNRPVALAMEDKGTLFFSTSTETSLFRDLQKNPFISFTTMIDQQSWIQINAEIAFVEDMAIKEMIIANNPFLNQRFQTADNHIFKIFKLTAGTAKIYDRSGNAPRIIKF
ncbi:pyridoxamine 5'-phosphate oxidase family protein [Sebaldella sp. S0638]|uniref:pyridoxamine 5'-phosphate oxidase family protein n=1 Tax=Sebaldella sp. S0638 TaxID=2957809 RepID=UPI00209CCEE9|nr:pyridoxamine 5'-phosphate oxidase family protein [Sebaldella sp. S0638]MCP1224870.1 pyridoxamine 5'-phosphate oxidase family protein [Sebaldella sp. S0638]